MIIRIKNMVCPRCITAVESILTSLNLTIEEVKLGEAKVKEELTAAQILQLKSNLQSLGFELLDDPCACLVEEIRLAVIRWVRMTEDRPRLSDFVKTTLNKDYSGLSKLFTQVKGITIEHYAIQHRIEYAKELLCYSQLSVSEISYQLGYSSPTHLTTQFKQQTGMTPKQFRSMDNKERLSLDEI